MAWLKPTYNSVAFVKNYTRKNGPVRAHMRGNGSAKCHYVCGYVRKGSEWVRGYKRGVFPTRQERSVENKQDYFDNIDRNVRTHLEKHLKARGYYEEPTTEKFFMAAFDNARDAQLVKGNWHEPTPNIESFSEDHPSAMLHITREGSVVTVDEDGNIANCRHPFDKLRGRDLIDLSIELGGTKYDGYEGDYMACRRAGLVPVAYVGWDNASIPEGWDPEIDDEEDIILYVPQKVLEKQKRRGYAPKDILDWKWLNEPFTTYEEACAYRDAILAGEKLDKETRI